MMCYRDMTFCSYWQDCKDGNDCHRALTIEVQNNAETNNLDICQYAEKPECFIEK